MRPNLTDLQSQIWDIFYLNYDEYPCKILSNYMKSALLINPTTWELNKPLYIKGHSILSIFPSLYKRKKSCTGYWFHYYNHPVQMYIYRHGHVSMSWSRVFKVKPEGIIKSQMDKFTCTKLTIEKQIECIEWYKLNISYFSRIVRWRYDINHIRSIVQLLTDEECSKILSPLF